MLSQTFLEIYNKKKEKYNSLMRKRKVYNQKYNSLMRKRKDELFLMAHSYGYYSRHRDTKSIIITKLLELIG